VPVHTNKERGLHIRRGTLEDRHVLFDVWLRSVEATHAFVSDTDIQAFKPLVRDYLASRETEFWVLCDADGTVAGFMGMGGPNVESLFLAPEFHRRGGGRRLIEHALARHRELTVDVSRWGEPGNMNGQFVVQPETVPANVFRFAIPAGLVTHSFRWEPGRVSFKTVRKTGTTGGDSVVAERLFTARVPTAGAETPHLTLLYDRNAARPPAKAAEVVVEKFAFLP